MIDGDGRPVDKQRVIDALICRRGFFGKWWITSLPLPLVTVCTHQPLCIFLDAGVSVLSRVVNVSSDFTACNTCTFFLTRLQNYYFIQMILYWHFNESTIFNYYRIEDTIVHRQVTTGLETRLIKGSLARLLKIVFTFSDYFHVSRYVYMSVPILYNLFLYIIGYHSRWFTWWT